MLYYSVLLRLNEYRRDASCMDISAADKSYVVKYLFTDTC